MNAPTTRETADHAELATNEKLRQLSAWNSYVESKPAQQRAHQKVKYAVEKGRLIVPEVCSECDQHAGYAKDGRRLLQAHHDDYSKPLDVRWLCIPCHRAITPVNPHRGSSAVTAEIMEEDAIYIRSSCRSHIELSEMFGVDHSAIRQVRRGATWAHVPTYENLLSEIAALREERDEQEATKLAAYDRLSVEILDRDQAERQRDELRKALERLASSEAFETPRVIDGPLAPEMRARMSYARQAIANQGADQ